MVGSFSYRLEGSYYEACNCNAICPCRRLNGAPGRDSTYGRCEFLLSWRIAAGRANDVNLSGLQVALAGFYVDAVPGKPWSVCIYIDDKATSSQFEALRSIYTGKAGGNMMFPGEFGEIFDVKPAKIVLQHSKGSQSIKVSELGSASVVRAVEANGTVTCAIPGHDHLGQEYVCNLAVADGPLKWRHEERCGFSTDFAYWN